MSKTIIITGASSGIGAATALQLAKSGANLVLGARRLDRLEQVAAQCRTLGGHVEVLPCDVRNRPDVEALVARAVEKFGRLDVMLANAGYGMLARVHETTDEQFDDIFATNVKGTWYAMRAAANVMLQQEPRAGAGGGGKARRGHIIAVSSGAGRRGMPLYGVYAMTKAAQLSLCEAMRVELMSRGVYVSSVHPLTTATEFFDEASRRSLLRSRGMGRMHSVETVARKIAGLIRRPRPELWPVPGSNWLLALATLLPGMADRSMARHAGRRAR
jgi:NAD(P)-dependent dehydrogenase (short-subunit alcohol dehydrogenase family)